MAARNQILDGSGNISGRLVKYISQASLNAYTDFVCDGSSIDGGVGRTFDMSWQT